MTGRFSSRRASLVVALLLSASATALVVGACRGIVAGDDYTSVVEHFCDCSEKFPELFDDRDDCVQILSDRLGGTEGKVLADWLAKYESQCKDSCTAARACYYTLPVCSFGSCKTDQECCSYYDGGPDACTEGQCAQITP